MQIRKTFEEAIYNDDTRVICVTEGQYRIVFRSLAVDPVHEMGGVYCHECKFWRQRMDGETGYCDEDGLTYCNDFCKFGVKKS